MSENYFHLGASAEAETGSRASMEPASSLHPTGFDPARIGVNCAKVAEAVFYHNNDGRHRQKLALALVELIHSAREQ